MSKKNARPRTTGTSAPHTGWILAMSTLGFMCNNASAEQTILLDAAEPLQVGHSPSFPFTESETRVKVYTDSHGRVVREVDLHLVIVGESATYDPEWAPGRVEQRSVAAVAQEALDQAFETATQDLADTFGHSGELNRLLSDPAIHLNMDDYLPETMEGELALWADSDGFSLRTSISAATPEPSTAVLLAVGFLPVVFPRRRNATGLPAGVAPTRTDTVG